MRFCTIPKFFFSCANEDDNPFNEEYLIGTWKRTYTNNGHNCEEYYVLNKDKTGAWNFGTKEALLKGLYERKLTNWYIEKNYIYFDGIFLSVPTKSFKRSGHMIKSITSNVLTIENGGNENPLSIFYKQSPGSYIGTIKFDNNTDGGDNDNNNGQSPEVEFLKYTNDTKNIFVIFKYEDNGAPLTSYFVEYGESEFCGTKCKDAQASGAKITASATNLKPNTAYYFMCTVTNKYGTSTTEPIMIMTDQIFDPNK